MKILITGADGFIGRALAARLLADRDRLDVAAADTRITLLDRQFVSPPVDSRVCLVRGDITDSRTLEDALSVEADCVFHLASLPGGAAEANVAQGLKVNVQATLALLELLRLQRTPAKVVFASTVGVYGVPLPRVVDEHTAAEPTLTYGAHKLVSEVLIADYSRRGFIDGCALRLPGIVARPAQSSGLLSAFMSDLIRQLCAGQHFTCPVSPDGTSWWMSRACAVDNLLHAASLSRMNPRRRRVYLLPVLHASMAEVVAAIARIHGPEVATRVTYQPNGPLQAQFANLPPLRCPASMAAGFRHDGTLDRLVQRALDGP